MESYIFKQELEHILSYWSEHTIEKKYGGFYSKIDREKHIYHQEKALALHAQILWSFSASYRFVKHKSYLSLAKRGFKYLKNHFLDTVYSGVYYTVDDRGNPLDTKKYLCAQASAIHGLSEYFGASEDAEALDMAKDIFMNMEKYSFDTVDGGYLEVLDQQWQRPKNLGDKDANEKKTTATHLRILEAYTNLYRYWPDPDLKQQIKALLHLFFKHIINPENHHLRLAFDESWHANAATVSFGKDMEASWLLLEAAQQLDDESLIKKVQKVAVSLCESAATGLNADGSLSYTYEPATNDWNREKYCWVQAEAMVGFYNAWQISLAPRFYQDFERAWQYIEQYMIDKQSGEWLWVRTAQNAAMQEQENADLGKCLYHNVRACLELMKRMGKNSQ